ERMEIGADQNVRVGTGAPRLPHQGAASRVERGQPAAYAEFAARASDQDPAVRDQRGHGDRLADIDVREPRAPDFAPGFGVERDGLPVERVEEQPAAGEDGAAIDDVAAGD